MDISEDLKAQLELQPYLKHFKIQYDLLRKRYERLKEIDNPLDDNLDIGTYFDMVIVQLRAIFIESPSLKNNYTLQNVMRKIGKDDYADALDDILSREFIPDVSDMTIRTAIKLLADKFICHYDVSEGINSDNWGEAAYIESFLRNPYVTVNLQTIMAEITEIVDKGLQEYYEQELNK
ncbi:hypothetical protein D6855_15865 [Butyrivibrio sp. CB08]|uniref:hypothetical protein n=1 Tax=Butyrivibrio sp. CB08 TaxID=2364879 RepID=UPI000EA87652|nr:hypothetical protein [Butyrivibrio sp. CB08]RKM55412.1 hypothetical protein D6855_15865 [Butyrivibrio sp. CB08]